MIVIVLTVHWCNFMYIFQMIIPYINNINCFQYLTEHNMQNILWRNTHFHTCNNISTSEYAWTCTHIGLNITTSNDCYWNIIIIIKMCPTFNGTLLSLYSTIIRYVLTLSDQFVQNIMKSISYMYTCTH